MKKNLKNEIRRILDIRRKHVFLKVNYSIDEFFCRRGKSYYRVLILTNENAALYKTIPGPNNNIRWAHFSFKEALNEFKT